MIENNTITKQRIITLDILRIICALFIFMRHAHNSGGFSFGSSLNLLANDTTPMIMTLFFVLSGLSLALSNKNQNCILSMNNIKTFYLKRIISNIPVYYLIHILYYVCNYNTISFKQYLFYTPIELFGLQSIFSHVIGVFHNGGTWFISCLIFCYIAYPLIHNFVMRMKSIIKTIVLLIFLTFLLIYLPLYNNFTESLSLYTNSFIRLFEFATGVVLARIVFDEKIIKTIDNRKNILSIVILLAILVILILSFLNGSMFVKNNYIFFVIAIIFFSSIIRIDFGKMSKIITYASSLTYSFFVFQLIIWPPSIKVVLWLSLDEWRYKAIIPVILLTLFCILVHEIYEKPIQKLLRKKLLK